MYVCICNSITDKDIKRAVKQGHHCYDKVCEQLGTGNCCGRCTSHVHEVIADAHAENATKESNVFPINMMQVAVA